MIEQIRPELMAAVRERLAGKRRIEAHNEMLIARVVGATVCLTPPGTDPDPTDPNAPTSGAA